LRVVETQVRQYVVGAVRMVFASRHLLLLIPYRASTAFNRFPIHSTSGGGVVRQGKQPE